MEYVNVIIDNSTDHTDSLFTYGSEISGLKPGDKVIVPFTRWNKPREAYVHSLLDEPDQKIKNLKYVLEKDPDISLPSYAIELSEYMRERYFCRYIDAIKCFAPGGKKLKKERATSEERELFEKPLTPELTFEQTAALARIRPYMEKEQHKVFLVHGVTNSGKTEIYMNVIEESLRRGKNAVMLVPEIALTAQTIRRFTTRFGGENIAVLHSKLTAGERYEQWLKVRRGQVKIVIGARSAIFAPFENIGAIILDEEHESTYKSDKTPKYDTIEIATKIGVIQKAVVLLGSATPSLESSYRAKEGIYEHVVLEKRFNECPPPEVEIVDMREELLAGNKSIFSVALYEKMQAALENKEQIILFLNRRGYSTFLSCRSCGFVVRCNDCGISMTFHKAAGQVVCHYCGRREKIPPACPACGSKYMKHFGTGTEKVEEAARELFPNAIVSRLDLDTAQKKGSTDKILSDFAKGKADILIGTQLVAKGLDFSNVGLVGIVSADITLNLPDFRSSERTFQLVTQAAGRAGRRKKRGNVVLQTYSPDHFAIQTAAAQDYASFFKEEIAVRNQLGYPPYSDLILIVLATKNEEEAGIAAQKVKDAFLRRVGKEHACYVLGPKPAPVNKSSDLFRSQLLIKCMPEHWENYQSALVFVKKKVFDEKEKEWTFSIDVNPYGFY
ncbi:MAG: primosomal protein N' [Eubacteriales bacterium]|nr:primosomal protein N' [Eubacteriales bacterium]